MRTTSVEIDIKERSELIFDLMHDYERRLEWDPFMRQAYLLNNATAAGPGVSSRCVARKHAGGMAMDTVYITFKRPSVAAVKMTRGPFFLLSFGASIRHTTIDESSTRVVYRYSFKARPRWSAMLTEPVINKVLYRETKQRLQALRRFVESTPTN